MNSDKDLMKLKSTGKKFFIGLVNIETAEILETHKYREAEQADFHTDFYFSEENVMLEGENANIRFFWMNERGILDVDYQSKEQEATHEQILNILTKIECL